MLQMGALVGWTSPYLARLTLPDSPIFITLDQASWVASILNVGRLMGAVLGAICVQFCGSKNAVLATFVPFTLSWILIMLADSVIYLYAARIVGGLGIGMCFSCFPLYIGEVAAPQYRGAIVSVTFVGSPVAAMIASILGSFVSPITFGIYFIVPCILGIGIFLWLPESPHRLIKQNKVEMGKKSLRWYRGGGDVDEEFQDVMNYVSLSSATTFKEKLREFQSPYIQRVLILVVMLFIYMQACGLNSVMFYVELILKRAGFHWFKPAYAVVIMNTLGALFSLIAVFTIDRCGRKVLLVVSSSGVTIAMIGLGTHFLLVNRGYNADDLQLLPIASAFVFQSTFVIGLLTVPSTVLSEVFPSNIKGIAAFAASMVGGICAFGSSKLFQPMIDLVGESAIFYAHAFLVMTAIPYVLIFMPETKGKSLNQIQQDLMKAG